jgi:hypothetical protein
MLAAGVRPAVMVMSPPDGSMRNVAALICRACGDRGGQWRVFGRGCVGVGW